MIFGQGVVLRHPHKVRLGDGVTLDDLVVLDAKGTTNRGIDVGAGSFLGRGTILSCKDGDITLGDHANLGFHCEIFSGSSVTVGAHALFAAQVYLVGGGHAFEATGAAVIDQPRTSRGIVLGDNVWLGHRGQGARRRSDREGRGGGRGRSRERGPARRCDRGGRPGARPALAGGR